MAWQSVGHIPQAACFYTDLVDLTATPASYVLNGSQMPGFLFFTTLIRGFNITTAGTISTSFTASMGNDASHVIVAASQTPATTAFSSAAAPGVFSMNAVASPATGLVDLATPISLVITVAAVGTDGTFRWKGRLAALGFLVPSS